MKSSIALKRSTQPLQPPLSTGLVSRLIDFYNVPECICLFGSYAKGEDIGESDIDLAIVTSNKKLSDLGSYEETLKRKISIHLVKDVKKRMPASSTVWPTASYYTATSKWYNTQYKHATRRLKIPSMLSLIALYNITKNIHVTDMFI